MKCKMGEMVIGRIQLNAETELHLLCLKGPAVAEVCRHVACLREREVRFITWIGSSKCT